MTTSPSGEPGTPGRTPPFRGALRLDTANESPGSRRVGPGGEASLGVGLWRSEIGSLWSNPWQPNLGGSHDPSWSKAREADQHNGIGREFGEPSEEAVRGVRPPRPSIQQNRGIRPSRPGRAPRGLQPSFDLLTPGPSGMGALYAPHIPGIPMREGATAARQAGQGSNQERSMTALRKNPFPRTWLSSCRSSHKELAPGHSRERSS